ncbi:unnamed protein product [Alopecurus aequalis]
MAGLGMGAPIVKIYHEKSMILPDVSRVLACLYEKDIGIERHTASYKSLLKLQASSHAPVPFYDGLTFLEDSREICRYIAETYEHRGEPFLLGKDSLERASIEQWLHHEEHAFNPPSRSLFCHLAFPLTEDDDDIDLQKIKLEEVLEVYEQRLGDTEFLAGNKFTLADLVHLPNSHYITESDKFAYLYDSRKNVQRWWNAISTRKSWQNVLKDIQVVEQQRKQEELEKQQRRQWLREHPPPTRRQIRLDSRKQASTKSQTILVPPPVGIVSTSPTASQVEKHLPTETSPDETLSTPTTHKSSAFQSKHTTIFSTHQETPPATAQTTPRLPGYPHIPVESTSNSFNPDTSSTTVENLSRTGADIPDNTATNADTQDKKSVRYTDHTPQRPVEPIYGGSTDQRATYISPGKHGSTETHQKLQAEKWQGTAVGLSNLKGETDYSVPTQQVKPGKDVRHSSSQDSEEVSTHSLAQEPVSMDRQLGQGPEMTTQEPYTDQKRDVSSMDWRQAADVRGVAEEDKASSDHKDAVVPPYARKHAEEAKIVSPGRRKDPSLPKRVNEEDTEARPFQTARETAPAPRRRRAQDANDTSEVIETYHSSSSRAQPINAPQDAAPPPKQAASEGPRRVTPPYPAAQEFIKQARESPASRSAVPRDAQGSTEEETKAGDSRSTRERPSDSWRAPAPLPRHEADDVHRRTTPSQKSYPGTGGTIKQAEDITSMPRRMAAEDADETLEETKFPESAASQAQPLYYYRPDAPLRKQEATEDRAEETSKKPRAAASKPTQIAAQDARDVLSESKVADSTSSIEQPSDARAAASFQKQEIPDARNTSASFQKTYPDVKGTTKKSKVTFEETKSPDSASPRVHPLDSQRDYAPSWKKEATEAPRATTPFKTRDSNVEDTAKHSDGAFKPRQIVGQDTQGTYEEAKASDSGLPREQSSDTWQAATTPTEKVATKDGPRGTPPSERNAPNDEDTTMRPRGSASVPWRTTAGDASDAYQESKPTDSVSSREQPLSARQPVVTPRQETEDSLSKISAFQKTRPFVEDSTGPAVDTVFGPRQIGAEDAKDITEETKLADSASSVRARPTYTPRTARPLSEQAEAEEDTRDKDRQGRETISAPKKMVSRDGEHTYGERNIPLSASREQSLDNLQASSPLKQTAAEDSRGATRGAKESLVDEPKTSQGVKGASKRSAGTFEETRDPASTLTTAQPLSAQDDQHTDKSSRTPTSDQRKDASTPQKGLGSSPSWAEAGDEDQTIMDENVYSSEQPRKILKESRSTSSKAQPADSRSPAKVERTPSVYQEDHLVAPDSREQPQILTTGVRADRSRPKRQQAPVVPPLTPPIANVYDDQEPFKRDNVDDPKGASGAFQESKPADSVSSREQALSARQPVVTPSRQETEDPLRKISAFHKTRPFVDDITRPAVDTVSGPRKVGAEDTKDITEETKVADSASPVRARPTYNPRPARPLSEQAELEEDAREKDREGRHTISVPKNTVSRDAQDTYGERKAPQSRPTEQSLDNLQASSPIKQAAAEDPRGASRGAKESLVDETKHSQGVRGASKKSADTFEETKDPASAFPTSQPLSAQDAQHTNRSSRTPTADQPKDASTPHKGLGSSPSHTEAGDEDQAVMDEKVFSSKAQPADSRSPTKVERTPSVYQEDHLVAPDSREQPQILTTGVRADRSTPKRQQAPVVPPPTPPRANIYDDQEPFKRDTVDDPKRASATFQESKPADSVSSREQALSARQPVVTPSRQETEDPLSKISAFHKTRPLVEDITEPAVDTVSGRRQVGAEDTKDVTEETKVADSASSVRARPTYNPRTARTLSEQAEVEEDAREKDREGRQTISVPKNTVSRDAQDTYGERKTPRSRSTEQSLDNLQASSPIKQAATEDPRGATRGDKESLVDEPKKIQGAKGLVSTLPTAQPLIARDDQRTDRSSRTPTADQWKDPSAQAQSNNQDTYKEARKMPKESRSASSKAQPADSRSPTKVERTPYVYQEDHLVTPDSHEQPKTLQTGVRADGSTAKRQQAPVVPSTSEEKSTPTPPRAKVHDDHTTEEPFKRDTVDDPKGTPIPLGQEPPSRVQRATKLTPDGEMSSKPPTIDQWRRTSAPMQGITANSGDDVPDVSTIDPKPTPMSQQTIPSAQGANEMVKREQRRAPSAPAGAQPPDVQHTPPSFAGADMDERDGEPVQMQEQTLHARPTSVPTRRETPDARDTGDNEFADASDAQRWKALKAKHDAGMISEDVPDASLSTHDATGDKTPRHASEAQVSDTLPSSTAVPERFSRDQGAILPESTQAHTPFDAPRDSVSTQGVPSDALDKTKFAKPSSTEGMTPTAGSAAALEAQSAEHKFAPSDKKSARAARPLSSGESKKEDTGVPAADQTKKPHAIFRQQSMPSTPIIKQVPSSNADHDIRKIQQVTLDNLPTDDSLTPVVPSYEQVSRAPQTIPSERDMTPAPGTSDSPASNTQILSEKFQEAIPDSYAPDESTVPFVSSEKQGSYSEPHEGPSHDAADDKDITKYPSKQAPVLEYRPDFTSADSYVHPTSGDELGISPDQGAESLTAAQATNTENRRNEVFPAEKKFAPSDQDLVHSVQQPFPAETRRGKTVVAAAEQTLPTNIGQQNTQDMREASTSDFMPAQDIPSDPQSGRPDELALAGQKLASSDQDTPLTSSVEPRNEEMRNSTRSAQPLFSAADDQTKDPEKTTIGQQDVAPTPGTPKSPSSDADHASGQLQEVAPDDHQAKPSFVSDGPTRDSDTDLDKKTTTLPSSQAQSSDPKPDPTQNLSDEPPTRFLPSQLPKQRAETQALLPLVGPYDSSQDVTSDTLGKANSLKPSSKDQETRDSALAPDTHLGSAPREVAPTREKLPLKGQDSTHPTQKSSFSEPTQEESIVAAPNEAKMSPTIFTQQNVGPAQTKMNDPSSGSQYVSQRLQDITPEDQQRGVTPSADKVKFPFDLQASELAKPPNENQEEVHAGSSFEQREGPNPDARGTVDGKMPLPSSQTESSDIAPDSAPISGDAHRTSVDGPTTSSRDSEAQRPAGTQIVPPLFLEKIESPTPSSTHQELMTPMSNSAPAPEVPQDQDLTTSQLSPSVVSRKDVADQTNVLQSGLREPASSDGPATSTSRDSLSQPPAETLNVPAVFLEKIESPRLPSTDQELVAPMTSPAPAPDTPQDKDSTQSPQLSPSVVSRKDVADANQTDVPQAGLRVPGSSDATLPSEKIQEFSPDTSLTKSAKPLLPMTVPVQPPQEASFVYPAVGQPENSAVKRPLSEDSTQSIRDNEKQIEEAEAQENGSYKPKKIRPDKAPISGDARPTSDDGAATRSLSDSRAQPPAGTLRVPAVFLENIKSPTPPSTDQEPMSSMTSPAPALDAPQGAPDALQDKDSAQSPQLSSSVVSRKDVADADQTNVPQEGLRGAATSDATRPSKEFSPDAYLSKSAKPLLHMTDESLPKSVDVNPSSGKQSTPSLLRGQGAQRPALTRSPLLHESNEDVPESSANQEATSPKVVPASVPDIKLGTASDEIAPDGQNFPLPARDLARSAQRPLSVEPTKEKGIPASSDQTSEARTIIGQGGVTPTDKVETQFGLPASELAKPSNENEEQVHARSAYEQSEGPTPDERGAVDKKMPHPSSQAENSDIASDSTPISGDARRTSVDGPTTSSFRGSEAQPPTGTQNIPARFLEKIESPTPPSTGQELVTPMTRPAPAPEAPQAQDLTTSQLSPSVVSRKDVADQTNVSQAGLREPASSDGPATSALRDSLSQPPAGTLNVPAVFLEKIESPRRPSTDQEPMAPMTSQAPAPDTPQDEDSTQSPQFSPSVVSRKDVADANQTDIPQAGPRVSGSSDTTLPSVKEFSPDASVSKSVKPLHPMTGTDPVQPPQEDSFVYPAVGQPENSPGKRPLYEESVPLLSQKNLERTLPEEVSKQQQQTDQSRTRSSKDDSIEASGITSPNILTTSGDLQPSPPKESMQAAQGSRNQQQAGQAVFQSTRDNKKQVEETEAQENQFYEPKKIRPDTAPISGDAHPTSDDGPATSSLRDSWEQPPAQTLSVPAVFLENIDSPTLPSTDQEPMTSMPSPAPAPDAPQDKDSTQSPQLSPSPVSRKDVADADQTNVPQAGLREAGSSDARRPSEKFSPDAYLTKSAKPLHMTDESLPKSVDVNPSSGQQSTTRPIRGQGAQRPALTRSPVLHESNEDVPESSATQEATSPKVVPASAQDTILGTASDELAPDGQNIPLPARDLAHSAQRSFSVEPAEEKGSSDQTSEARTIIGQRELTPSTDKREGPTPDAHGAADENMPLPSSQAENSDIAPDSAPISSDVNRTSGDGPTTSSFRDSDTGTQNVPAVFLEKIESPTPPSTDQELMKPMTSPTPAPEAQQDQDLTTSQLSPSVVSRKDVADQTSISQAGLREPASSDSTHPSEKMLSADSDLTKSEKTLGPMKGADPVQAPYEASSDLSSDEKTTMIKGDQANTISNVSLSASQAVGQPGNSAGEGPISEESVSPFSQKNLERRSPEEKSKKQQPSTRSSKDDSIEARGTANSNILTRSGDIAQSPAKESMQEAQEPRNQQQADQAVFQPRQDNEKQIQETEAQDNGSDEKLRHKTIDSAPISGTSSDAPATSSLRYSPSQAPAGTLDVPPVFLEKIEPTPRRPSTDQELMTSPDTPQDEDSTQSGQLSRSVVSRKGIADANQTNVPEAGLRVAGSSDATLPSEKIQEFSPDASLNKSAKPLLSVTGTDPVQPPQEASFVYSAVGQSENNAVKRPPSEESVSLGSQKNLKGTLPEEKSKKQQQTNQSSTRSSNDDSLEASGTSNTNIETTGDLQPSPLKESMHATEGSRNQEQADQVIFQSTQNNRKQIQENEAQDSGSDGPEKIRPDSAPIGGGARRTSGDGIATSSLRDSQEQPPAGTRNVPAVFLENIESPRPPSTDQEPMTSKTSPAPAPDAPQDQESTQSQQFSPSAVSRKDVDDANQTDVQQAGPRVPGSSDATLPSERIQEFSPDASPSVVSRKGVANADQASQAVGQSENSAVRGPLSEDVVTPFSQKSLKGTSPEEKPKQQKQTDQSNTQSPKDDNIVEARGTTSPDVSTSGDIQPSLLKESRQAAEGSSNQQQADQAAFEEAEKRFIGPDEPYETNLQQDTSQKKNGTSQRDAFEQPEELVKPTEDAPGIFRADNRSVSSLRTSEESKQQVETEGKTQGGETKAPPVSEAELPEERDVPSRNKGTASQSQAETPYKPQEQTSSGIQGSEANSSKLDGSTDDAKPADTDRR